MNQRLELSVVTSTRTWTWLAAVHAALALTAFVAVAFFKLPAALGVGAPSIIILLVGFFQADVPRPAFAAWVNRARALEGDTVTIKTVLRSRRHIPLVDIEFLPNPRFAPEGPLRALLSVTAAREPSAEFLVRVDDWGLVQLGRFVVRARDRFGLMANSTTYQIMTPMRIHIHEEAARSLSEPNRFRRLVGSHQSAARGEGCEIADVRPYQPGDRLQSLNWRISARNDEPWITLRHPDRSTTVVLLVDSHESSSPSSKGELRRSIRAALGLARLHVGAQDPVGMMVVDTGFRWVKPGQGRMHMHRLTDVLLELSTRRWASQAFSIRAIERQIPKDAVVLAVSSLSSRRFRSLLTSLRARGQSLSVIEPVTYWPDHTVAKRGRHHFEPYNAWRVQSLYNQRERALLSQQGIPVIPWEEDQPIESVLLALRMSQRARSSVIQ